MQISNARSTGLKIPSAHYPRLACYNRGLGFTPLSPPWPSIMKSTMSPFPNLNRARIAFAHDTVMAAISFPLSMYLRLGDFYYFYLGEYVLGASLAFAAISAPIFLYSRMYRGIWAYASIEDLAVITKGVTLSILIFLPALFLFTRLEQLPRSLPLIQWFVLMALLGGPRFLYRVLKDRRLENILKRSNHRRVPVMLIGAGDAAELFIRQNTRDRNAPYSVVAILDDKGGRVGRSIHGVPIVAGLEELSDTLASGQHGQLHSQDFLPLRLMSRALPLLHLEYMAMPSWNSPL